MHNSLHGCQKIITSTPCFPGRCFFSVDAKAKCARYGLSRTKFQPADQPTNAMLNCHVSRLIVPRMLIRAGNSLLFAWFSHLISLQVKSLVFLPITAAG